MGWERQAMMRYLADPCLIHRIDGSQNYVIEYQNNNKYHFSKGHLTSENQANFIERLGRFLSNEGLKRIVPSNIRTSNIPSAGQGLLSLKLCNFCNSDFREVNILFNARHISRLSPLPVVVLWILLIIRVTPIFFSNSTRLTLLYLSFLKHSTAQHSMVTPIFFASPLLGHCCTWVYMKYSTVW